MKKIIAALVVLFTLSASMFAQATGWEWLNATKKVDKQGVLPAVDPRKVTGDIITAGSSTVYPLSEAIAARFAKEGFVAKNGKITIDSIGSGAGRERFVKGEIQIANASSPIKKSELDIAATNNIKPIEFKIAIDALAVVVNKKNTFIKNATKDELAKIFTAEFWSDVNPSYPKQKILRFIPGTDSGTFDYFVEKIYDKKKDPILAAPNTQKSEDDNILIKGIEGNEFAIGFFGFAYYNEQKARLNLLSFDGVTANVDTVQKNQYGLSRPLFMYTDANILKKNPQAAAFINYYLTVVNEEVRKVGYFPLHDEDLKASKQLWVDTLKDMIK